MNRTQSIRLFCLDCTAGSYENIRSCSFTKCPLYSMRMGTTPKGMSKPKAIHKHCKECNGGVTTTCPVHDCSLFPFRSGLRTKNISIGEVFTKHVYVMRDRICKGMANLREGYRND